jgi:hypothetical protein
MVRSVQDLARQGRDTGAMELCCEECGHGLWAEEVPVADRFGVLACFDDDENSDTYSERVGRCPGCGAWVNAKELLVTHEGHS